MQHSPLVSIALCTYNGAKYIEAQLDSILAQTYRNFEIVIVDDASTDSTVQLLQEYAQQHNFIKLILNPTNVGFNENFKYALSKCTGKFIAIADQDDVWLPHKIDFLVQNIGSNLLIYHDSEFIDEVGRPLNIKTSTHHRFVEGNCSESLLYYNCVSGHTTLFSIGLRECLDYMPNGMYYDWWLAYSASCSGKITFVKDSLVKHRKHTNSSTANDITNPREERVKTLTHFKNHPLTHKSLAERIETLLQEYTNTKSFSFKLFRILMMHSELLFIRKRSYFSKIKMFIRECIPYK